MFIVDMPTVNMHYQSQQVPLVGEGAGSVSVLEKPFKCTQCDLWFTTNAARNIHSKIHTVGEIFKCTVCSYVTNDYNDLRKHRLDKCSLVKPKILRCHACDFKCHRKDKLKAHFFSAHTDPGKILGCTECEFKTLKINTLQTHMRQQHSAPLEYACTRCDFVCNSQAAIKKHIANQHPEQEQEQEAEGDKADVNKYACVSCEYTCNSIAKIKDHISQNHSDDTPSNVQDENINQNEDDPIAPADKFSCKKCDFQCDTARGIEVHLARVHKDSFTKSPSGKKYKQTNQLFEPIPIGHHPVPVDGKIAQNDESRKYKCPLCKYKGTMFGFKLHRRRHMKGYYDGKALGKAYDNDPNLCKICGTRFTTVHGLKIHMNSHDKGYACKSCDFKCDTKLGFQSHMEFSHSSAKRFSCPNCNYKCSTQMDLRRHISSHEPQKAFSCPECEDSYDDKTELMTHMLSLNHTGGKPFACTRCKAQFLTDVGLKIHLESHEPQADPLEENNEQYSADIRNIDEREAEHAEREEYVERDEEDDENEKPFGRRKMLRKFDPDYIFEEDKKSRNDYYYEEYDHYEGKKYDGFTYNKNRNRVVKPIGEIGKFRCFHVGCDFVSHTYNGVIKHSKISKAHREIKDIENNIKVPKQHQQRFREKKQFRCYYMKCSFMSYLLTGIKIHAKNSHKDLKGVENDDLDQEEIQCDPIGSDSTSVAAEGIIEEKENKTEKCPKCPYIGNARGLSSHSKAHTAVKPFACKRDECDFRCFTQRVLNTHVAQTHGKKDKDKNEDEPLQCSFCDYIGTRKGLKSHSKAHTAVKPFACKNCDFTCFTEKVLNTHIGRKHGNKAFACSECDYIGSSLIGFSRHNSKAHKKVIVHIDIPEYKTEIGHKLRDTTEKEIEDKTEKETENKIENEIKDKTEKEIEDKTEKGIEDETEKEIDDKTEKEIEDKTEKEIEDKTEKEVEDKTEKEVEDKTEKEDGKSVKEIEDKTEKEIESKTEKCPECDYVGTLKGLKIHSRAHGIMKPFSCKKCDFSCFTQKVLATHHSRKHGNEAFACSKCDYRGNSQIGFSRHSKKVHNIDIPFSIPKVIHKKGVSVNDTEKEIYDETKELSDDEESSQGSVELPSESGDEEWTPSAIESPKVKPFLCLECEARFASKNDLKTHMSMHYSKLTPKKIVNEIVHDKSKEIGEKASEESTVSASKETPLSEKRIRLKNLRYASDDFHTSIQGYTPEYLNRLEKKEKVDHERKNKDNQVEKKEKVDHKRKIKDVEVEKKVIIKSPENETKKSPRKKQKMNYDETVEKQESKSSENVKFSCEVCGLKFPTRRGIQVHTAISHKGFKRKKTIEKEQKKIADETMKCEKCEFTCSTEKEIHVHMIKVHKDSMKNREIVKKLKVNADKTLYCHDCDTTFLNEKGMQVHLSSSKHKDKYKDKTVGKKHTDMKLYCEECDMKFPTEKGMKLHLSMIHPSFKVVEKEQKMIADDIAAELHEESNLKNDDEIETAPERRRKSSSPRKVVNEYYIEKNGKSKDSSLSNKTKTTRGKKKKTKKVKVDQKSKDENIDVKIQKKSSSPKKVIKSKAVKPNSVSSTTKSTKSNITAQSPQSHKGEKPFLCLECGERFADKNELKTHMFTHLDEDPYKCKHEKCDYSAKNEEQLVSHIAKAHKIVVLDKKKEDTTTKSESHSNPKMESISTPKTSKRIKLNRSPLPKTPKTLKEETSTPKAPQRSSKR